VNNRLITNPEEVQAKIRSAAQQMYDVAVAAYGPSSGNVLLGQEWGDPITSHDGVTNLSQIELEDDFENAVAAVIKQAAKKCNEVVGDGTTASTILAYHLLQEAQKRVAGGINRMVVARELQDSAFIALEHLDKLSKPVNMDGGTLLAIATISSGNSAVGSLVSHVIEEVGVDGGTTIEDSPALGVSYEIVDGFHFAKGLPHLAFATDYAKLEAAYTAPEILITNKKLSTATDMGLILEKLVAGGIKELVIIGEVKDDALAMLALNKHKGILTVTPVEPPVSAGNRVLFLEDIAKVTGSTVLGEGMSGADFDISMLGSARSVTVTQLATTIIGGEGDHIEEYIAKVQAQLDEATHPVDIQAIKDRLSKLSGKVAIIRVGGATTTEQKETRLRVEDAVCASQAALKGGVVPGGGVALATVSGTSFDNAYKALLRQLVHNAGLNPEKILSLVESAPSWHGFDLLTVGDKPVDMYEAGVIDPTLAIREVVIRATSVAADLIKTAAIKVVVKEKENG
jgi:chaperonin GroEL